MTLNEKLDLIRQARDDIKASLVDKGLEVNTDIRTYAEAIDSINVGPVTFSTVEEMHEHTDLAEDTFAIVYGTSYIGTYRLDNGTWTQIGDSTEEQQIMNVLNDVVASTEQYEGTGGTDEEINEVFDNILGGN